jgi:polyhydroxybutyrate depolymerase
LVDVRLTDDLLNALQADYPYDPHQVYAAGFSNGGLQVQMLACFLPERFHGFAVVHQTLHKHVREACAPSVIRPLLYVNGTADEHWDGRDFSLSAMETVDFWKQRLGCGSPEQKEALPDLPSDRTRVERWGFSGCREPFRFVRIEGGGHSWPGSRFEHPTHCLDLSATAETLRFFQASAGLRPLGG